MKDALSVIMTSINSFDTIGNMPGYYTTRVDPNVEPVHAYCKVLIELRRKLKPKYRE